MRVRWGASQSSSSQATGAPHSRLQMSTKSRVSSRSIPVFAKTIWTPSGRRPSKAWMIFLEHVSACAATAEADDRGARHTEGIGPAEAGQTVGIGGSRRAGPCRDGGVGHERSPKDGKGSGAGALRAPHLRSDLGMGSAPGDAECRVRWIALGRREVGTLIGPVDGALPAKTPLCPGRRRGGIAVDPTWGVRITGRS